MRKPAKDVKTAGLNFLCEPCGEGYEVRRMNANTGEAEITARPSVHTCMCGSTCGSTNGAEIKLFAPLFAPPPHLFAHVCGPFVHTCAWQLGIFKSPMMNAPSAFFPDAVSGTSMPPNHHPAAPRLQQQRDEFTRKMLVYVEGRCKQMPAVEQSVVESFFEEILSEWDGEGEDGESEDFCCEIYDSALTLDDLDARLKRAKERFEDACTKDKV